MLCKQWSPARAVDHIPLCPVHEAPCRSLEHVVSFRRHPIARRCDVSLLREPYVVLPLDKGANWAQRRSTTRRSPHRASVAAQLLTCTCCQHSPTPASGRRRTELVSELSPHLQESTRSSSTLSLLQLEMAIPTRLRSS